MALKEQLISKKIAKLAKEKGFGVSQPSRWIHKPYSESDPLFQPTQSLLQKWLRDKHNIHMRQIIFYDSKIKKVTFVCDVMHMDGDNHIYKSPREDSYEEALEIGLFNGLKLI
jgi:hypothetical protein